MKLSVKKGFSFGLTSGIITTLGVMVGLHSSTHSAMVVIGGILVIAIADALSDSVGMHISKEAENKHTTKEIWESTIATFITKFICALTFAVPVILFSLQNAVIISVLWGLSLITIFNFYMVRQQKEKSYKPVLEHLAIAVLVVIITHYVGDWVGRFS